MASITIVLRPSTRKGRHPGSLSLRVVHDRKVKTAATGCHLYNEEWDERRQTVIYPDIDPQRTALLDDVESKIAACREAVAGFITVLEKKGRYTAADVIGKLRRKKDDGKLLGYVDTLREELELSGRFRLSRAYRTVSEGLVKYNRDEDIPLTHLNACLIKGFEQHLKERGKAPNTISFYMRNLRSIYNKAMAAKRIPSKHGDPFIGAYTKVKSTDKRAMSAEEATRLYEIRFDALQAKYPEGTPEREYAENLYYSWRLFMFCFFAQGMCFIDMAYLRKDNIKGGVCRYYRHKTGQQVEVAVNEGMQKIIDSFAVQVQGSPYLLPVIKSEDKRQAYRQYETGLRTQNRRLKALAKLAKIDPRRLTTHVSRHSFATLVRSGGLPAVVISEMLGHSTEKMTHNYFASFERTYSDRAYHIIAGILSRPPGAMAASVQ